MNTEGATFPDYSRGSASAWDNLELRDDSTEATDLRTHPRAMKASLYSIEFDADGFGVGQHSGSISFGRCQ